jgi:glutathione S-transferase
MKLHDLELSGNCYKVRLLLALLEIECELVPVNLMSGEHKSPSFLQLNPLGQVPVLEDEELILRDSQAILVYLTKKYDSEAWLPNTPREIAQIAQWLSTAANEIAHGPAAARVRKKFGFVGDLEMAQQKTEAILGIIEQHLSDRHWLVLERPTIADLACFPYIALAPEGGVLLEPYPLIRKWSDRIKQLPGFIAMPGIT